MQHAVQAVYLSRSPYVVFPLLSVHYNCLHLIIRHTPRLATSNNWPLRYDTSLSDDERWEERHLAHLTARDYVPDLENEPGKDAIEEYLRVALHKNR